VPEKIIFRIHAIQRMFERRINEADVRTILKNAEVVADYADDKPFPSRLVLGYIHNKPLHIVIARNEEAKELIIVTVYEPDLTKWESDFKTRRKK